MSTNEIYFWGVVTGVAFAQAVRNTLWIIRFYRDRHIAAAGAEAADRG